VFWSKIWLFLIALTGAVALTIALVLPRPAQRALSRGEAKRLKDACSVIHILLADDARTRVDLAGAFARAPEVMNALEAASGVERLDEARMKQVRDVGETVMKAIQGARKPDFAMLIDRRGRVVARVRLDDGDFGDVAAGRPLIDDALAGYLRDDLWAQNTTMYFVSAAPVVKQDAYAGAVVLGHQVTNELAQRLVMPLGVDMGFHLGRDPIAGSKAIAFDHGAMQAAITALGSDPAKDCLDVKQIEFRAGAEDHIAVVARLPGEAGARQAYYSVIAKRPEELGLVGTLKAVTDSDLAFGNFPWILVAGGFLVVLVVGIGLMFVEVDRPLRRLTAEAVRLAKGETERMSEDAHAGKFGSIARSVNIHIDKLGREAKSAKKDLDQLLGPAPEGSLGTIDLLATALPAARPGGPATAVPPPPSDFRFNDSGPLPARTPPPRAGTPPAFRTASPPAVPPPAVISQPPPPPLQAPPPPPPNVFPQRSGLTFDDDILGHAPAEASPPRVDPTGGSAPRSTGRAVGVPTPRDLASPIDPTGGSAPRSTGRAVGVPTPRDLASPIDPYFKQIFDQFVSAKRSCNESTTGLVYEKFADKLVKNRDDLMHKTGCREVRFTVYIKDGKAALKATPVKDDA
jgi:hypothetical protein